MARISTGPGRPKGRDPEAVRNALLEAARSLFSQRAFKAVSVRELAATAKVNPAMVNYYFGDKQGLYEAMVEESLGPLLEALEEGVSSGHPISAQTLFSRYVDILAANPWLPNLLVREVLYGETGFRDRYVRKFAARFAAGMSRSLGEERAQGTMREDLDPDLTLLSFISLAVFPFLARPIVEQALGLEISPEFARRWAGHSLRLFTAPSPGATPA
jgi:TetR/AcrR family transcriptional regulator